MGRKYVFMALLLLLILLVAFVWYKAQGVKRTYRAGVLQDLGRMGASEGTLTRNDVKDLPVPVQKYLEYVGAIGRGKVHNVRLVLEGEMKMNPKGSWLRVRTQQYDFFDNPARLFFIQAAKFGIPFFGLDSFQNGKGNMLIKVAGLFTVADARGPEMDVSEAVTLFNDMCFVPSTLINGKHSAR